LNILLPKKKAKYLKNILELQVFALENMGQEMVQRTEKYNEINYLTSDACKMHVGAFINKSG